ncbi:MAG TPA: FAD:protein FMN transferase [Acidimicrobiia bacterium]|nr:FAD:protein FMN transferase [Acidimicrobiia bacterium]
MARRWCRRPDSSVHRVHAAAQELDDDNVEHVERLDVVGLGVVEQREQQQQQQPQLVVLVVVLVRQRALVEQRRLLVLAAAGDALGGVVKERTESASFRALGTTATVVVDGGDLAVAREILADEVGALDRACSRFRDDSELSAVNRAAGQPVVVGPMLLGAVEVALRAARMTDGRVDPTVGRALQVLGYDRTFDELPSDRPRSVVWARRVPGWQAITIDRRARTLRVPSGVQLDLGATAKAWAADRAAARIALKLERPVLVSLGGDVSAAGPTRPGGWPVRVTDDHAAGRDAPGETVDLHGGGLATSGTTVRRWSMGGEEHHHVVDPTTGRSARTPYRTVSVAAGSCVDANVATTAALVAGEDGPAWVARHGLPARFVAHDGTVTRVGGWPEPALPVAS